MTAAAPAATSPAGALDGALLGFTAAFVDTACFIALFGLFTAHVTGNFVLIGAALVGGGGAIVGKLLALPAFVVAVAAAAAAARALHAAARSALAPLLLGEAALLAAALVAAWLLPVPHDGNDIGALAPGLLAVAAMGVQNALMRLELAALAPTTVMTGNVTQLVVDALALRADDAASPAAAQRMRHVAPGLVAFVAGAAAGACGVAALGLAALAVPAALSVLLAWRLRAR